MMPGSIQEASTLLQKCDVASVELTEALLARAKERSGLNAYLELFEEDALAQASDADRRRKEGESGNLLGIPLAVKDNILIEGKRASAASRMLENYTATYDATVISKLRSEGAVFIGRTNMDEFALGGSTENSAFGPTKNPHDEERVAGGTSGGSAAAVAAGLALGALGSDTGGSVRNPASFCGVVGLKPTYGAVSRSGLIAAVSSFDQIGPIAKTVADTKLLFEAIKGRDPLDSTSTLGAVPAQKGKVIGVPANVNAGLDTDVEENFEHALKKLEGEGYEIRRDVALSSLPPSLASYYITNFAEVSTNLARFDGVRYGLHEEGEDLLGDYLKSRKAGFGPETRRRIILGTYVLSAGYYDAYYGKAAAARAALSADFKAAFEAIDFIATPTMPTPAFRIGEKADPLSLYLADVFTVPANLTGSPALSVPSGFVEREGKKLPVGIQFMAPHFGEDALLAVGVAFLGEPSLT